MKLTRTGIAFACAAIAVVCLDLFWPRGRGDAATPRATATNAEPKVTNESVYRATDATAGLVGQPSRLPPVPQASRLSDRPAETPTVERAFTAFTEWLERYEQSTGAERALFEEVGRDLAVQRRTALRSLIEFDPDRALELALPRAVVWRLPASIRPLVEEHVNARGDFEVIAELPRPETKARPPALQYSTKLADGRRFRTFPIQARREFATQNNIAVGGIALDGVLALGQPVRLLSRAEAVELGASARDAVCSISGQTAATGIDPAAVEVGGEIRWVCQTGHMEPLNEKTLAADKGSPPKALFGVQRALLMLVDFTDASVSCSALEVSNTMFSPLIPSVDGLYRETSYGGVSFTGIVVGPFQIPFNTSECDAGGWADAADSAAAASGVNLELYNRRIYVLPNGTCVFGLGTIGGNPSRSWIGDCRVSDVYAHELGHNVGMHHAGTDSNNDGMVEDEYADLSDFMGYSTGVPQYGWKQLNAPHKFQMGWLPTNKLATLTTTSTNQVSALELHPDAASSPLAWVIPIPGTPESYYLSFRFADPATYDRTLGTAYADRLNIHRYSSGAVYTRFIRALQDGQTFSDTALGFTFQQISHTTSNATFAVTFPPTTVAYNGGTLSENFDGLGAAGTKTPTGWFVGAALPANVTMVTVDDGSLAPSSSILGFNYGSTGSVDRALGTAPTGGDRNMVVRIRNNTESNIVAFTLRYDGEVWRNYASAVGALSNYVSFDEGATWTPTGFHFFQPFAPSSPQGPVDGNAAGNRTADIGGMVATPAPVPPGGVIYIRWHDFNDSGTDGGLAIDGFSFTAAFDQFQSFVTITSPTNGAEFPAGVPITIAASAAMANPITNVAFFRDGTLIGNDTNAPYSVVWSNSTAHAYVLTATATDATGNSITTTNPVIVMVNPNNPPVVSLVNPANGAQYFVGVTITNVSATASDSDGSIARLEFYLDGELRATDASSPYSFDLCDITVGTHTLSAVAVDNGETRGTNSISITATNPPGVIVLVSNGAPWRYLDNGTDQSNAWRALAFDDAGWSNGVAEFGYGDAPGRPERTTVGYGPNASSKFATTYFRKRFTVDDPGAFSGLILNVLHDDHAVVFLNGVQVYTDMTNAAITYQTYEQPAVPHDGTVYATTNLPASVLVAGTNIVAVEIHQDSSGSSDISFDLMLWAESRGALPLTVARFDATRLEISWPTGGNFTLEYKNDLNAPSWSPETAADNPSGGFHRVVVNVVGQQRFWRLRGGQ